MSLTLFLCLLAFIFRSAQLLVVTGLIIKNYCFPFCSHVHTTITELKQYIRLHRPSLLYCVLLLQNDFLEFLFRVFLKPCYLTLKMLVDHITSTYWLCSHRVWLLSKFFGIFLYTFWGFYSLHWWYSQSKMTNLQNNCL